MKILFIAETSSIHSARWVNQFSSMDWDIHVLQGIYPFSHINSEYNTGKFHCPFPANYARGIRGSLSRSMNRAFSHAISRIPVWQNTIQTRLQARLIRTIKPDIIHTLGLNINWKNNCLVTCKVKKTLGDGFTAPWIYSTWGSDLDFYARMSQDHTREVSAILPSVDYLITECARDEKLAYQFGFKGKCLAHLPAYGGISLDNYSRILSPQSPSKRKIIFLKGRDNGGGGDPVGRAMTAMEAFELCEKDLADYSIVINQASPKICSKAKELARSTSLKIQVLPFLPYDEILKILGSSRVFIALTVNDGLPSTLVESMALGAFPIHSNLEPIREWIDHGNNGLLVPPEDPDACADALRQALHDDNLVDAAQRTNYTLISEHLSEEIVKKRALQIYHTVIDEWYEMH